MTLPRSTHAEVRAALVEVGKNENLHDHHQRGAYDEPSGTCPKDRHMPPPEVEPTNGAGRLKLRNAMPAVHAAVKRRARPARCHTARYIGRYLITVVDQSALKDRTGVKPEGANPVDHRR
jgi:hypothetical protein